MRVSNDPDVLENSETTSVSSRRHTFKDVSSFTAAVADDKKSDRASDGITDLDDIVAENHLFGLIQKPCPLVDFTVVTVEYGSIFVDLSKDAVSVEAGNRECFPPNRCQPRKR